MSVIVLFAKDRQTSIVNFKDGKRTRLHADVCMNRTIDQLAVANSVWWYGCLLRRKDGHVWRKALEFEVEGERKERRSKGHRRRLKKP